MKKSSVKKYSKSNKQTPNIKKKQDQSIAKPLKSILKKSSKGKKTSAPGTITKQKKCVSFKMSRKSLNGNVQTNLLRGSPEPIFGAKPVHQATHQSGTGAKKKLSEQDKKQLREIYITDDNKNKLGALGKKLNGERYLTGKGCKKVVSGKTPTMNAKKRASSISYLIDLGYQIKDPNGKAVATDSKKSMDAICYLISLGFLIKAPTVSKKARKNLDGKDHIKADEEMLPAKDTTLMLHGAKKRKLSLKRRLSQKTKRSYERRAPRVRVTKKIIRPSRKISLKGRHSLKIKRSYKKAGTKARGSKKVTSPSKKRSLKARRSKTNKRPSRNGAYKAKISKRIRRPSMERCVEKCLKK